MTGDITGDITEDSLNKHGKATGGSSGSSGSTGPGEPAGPAEMPDRIGRYRIKRVLGQGGFGIVYLAHDEHLDRLVAVKVPFRDRLLSAERQNTYLVEAQTVAGLDHPNIVPVYDVGRVPGFPIFIVSKFIEGTSLADLLKQRRFKFQEATRLVIAISDALHYAHRKGIIHRDIKPGNILIGPDDQPYVVDFGLALREDSDSPFSNHAGTPAYMSPEQARGEGHRVDGRSDIFSLGAVLYELLVSRRPFRGSTSRELFDQVMSRDPAPLRQYDERLPRELGRICYRALAKRARDRYATAHDFADDLQHFLKKYSDETRESSTRGEKLETVSSRSSSNISDESPPETIFLHTRSGTSTLTKRSTAVVPKGLRSFDRRDADFFLDLLPGARDRHGVPDSIRFWINRIEETDPEQTFSVGLIYGPSGCGKSSLINAGLIPRLNEVITVCISATPADTESRLLHALRNKCPMLSDENSLVESISMIRRGEAAPADSKVLIVIDQFEQWLHAWDGEPNTQLANALRQCDGGRVQAVVLVRDDFWLAASRLMAEIEVDLLPGHNTAMVDLFDRIHSRKVLRSYGVAYGRLPESRKEMSSAQEQFLDQAIDALAEDGKIVSVKLAIFAEMVKSREWNPATLKSLGGIEGIGITFLEESFSSPSAPREYTKHLDVARDILTALLPAHNSDIRGHVRSEAELRKIAGYVNRPEEFAEMIRVLDTDLRIITPTDLTGDSTNITSSQPLAASTKEASSSGAEKKEIDATGPNEKESDKVTSIGVSTSDRNRYYQLTHDFLVPSLRSWLNQKQKATFAGRTVLRLEDRTSLWEKKPENRQLPSLVEWIRFNLWTRKSSRSKIQNQMLRSASKYYVTRLTIVAIMLGITCWGLVEGIGRIQANHLASQLQTADTVRVPEIINQYRRYLPWAEDSLRKIADETSPQSKENLHARLALLQNDDSQVGFLTDRMLDTDLITSSVVLGELFDHRQLLIDTLWKRVIESDEPSSKKLRAAIALASFSDSNAVNTDESWQQNSGLITDLVVDAISRTQDNEQREQLVRSFVPVAELLRKPLTEVFVDTNIQRRESASFLLERFACDDPQTLALLVTNSDATQFATFHKLLALHRDESIPLLEKSVHLQIGNADDEAQVIRTTNAAVALLLLEKDSQRVSGRVSSQLTKLLQEQPDPRLRTRLIHAFYPLNVPSESLVDLLLHERDAGVGRALLLALGEYPRESISDENFEIVVQHVLPMVSDRECAINHAVACWLLKSWNQSERVDTEMHKVVESENASIINDDVPLHGAWRIGPNDHLFIRIDGRQASGVGRVIEVSDREVSVAQYQKVPTREYINTDKSPTEDCPANVITWFEVLRYCHWLNEQENIPEDQWCFEPIGDSKEIADQITIGKLKVEFDLSKTGYRPPTSAEWRFFSKSGSNTLMHHGDTDDFLDEYAWTSRNSGNRFWPAGSLKPNDWGIFDVYGNVREWCADPLNSRHEAVAIGGSIGTDVRKDLTYIASQYDEPRALISQGWDRNGMRIVRTVIVEE